MLPIKQEYTKNKYKLDEKPFIIVLHTTLGSYSSAVSWLVNARGQNPNSSAHFVVGREGETAQLAPLNMGTWHAGRISNPSYAARRILRKTVWGKFKNPNRYSIGIEAASGYDIDRDGILESWEKLYAPKQIKQIAEIILLIEEKTGVSFTSKNILIHRDIASYKPNLSIQKAMVIAELSKLRNSKNTPTIVKKTSKTKKIFLREGDKVRGSVKDGNINLKKVGD